MLSKTSMANTVHDRKVLFPKIKLILIQLLFFLMVFVPRAAQSVKLGILLLLFLIIIVETLVTRTIRFNKVTRVFMILFLFYSILSGAIGLIKGNPGASDFIRVNIIFYILFSVIISSVSNKTEFERIIKTIIFSGNVVSIYTILLLLVSVGVWPPQYFYAFDVTSNVGIHSGFIHLTNTNLSMMIFILPFIMTLRLSNYNLKTIKKYTLTFSVVLATIAVLISGRRILWLSLLIPLFFYLIKIDKKKILKFFKKYFAFLIAASLFLAALSFSSYLSFNDMIVRFKDVFTGEEGNIRTSQIEALWNGFLENPILGSGAGIGVPEVIRSHTTPWIYEVSYNLILYNSGIIGSIFFFSSLLYLFVKLYREKLRGDILAEAILISYISVLISNATNPYFTSSFDFLWFIFFPLMYFNIKTTQPQGGR